MKTKIRKSKLKQMKHKQHHAFLAAAIMVKNEEKTIERTLKSCLNVVDKYIILDTGSTDQTKQIVLDFCNKHQKIVKYHETKFVDFSVSRNELLNHCQNESEFILLLDANDELKNSKTLLSQLRSIPSEYDGCYLQQIWEVNGHQESNHINIRIIRSNRGWNYREPVHEYICINNDGQEKIYPASYQPLSDVVVYQERTLDSGSERRWHRDKRLLLREYLKRPTHPRTVYYLAQTYRCLHDLENAYYYYQLRSTMGGFQEEVFLSLYYSAQIAQQMQMEWSKVMNLYLSAWKHSKRAEPLIKIIQHYMDTPDKDWSLAYLYLDMCCKLTKPKAILFCDENMYDYMRWSYMGIVAYYAGQYDTGKKAIQYLISKSLAKEHDLKNLQFYNSPNDNDKLYHPNYQITHVNFNSVVKTQNQKLEHYIKSSPYIHI